MIFIYTLSEPDSFNVRYVGMSRGVIRRWLAHIRVTDGRVNRMTHRQAWLAGLRSSGLKPLMQIVGIARDHVEASNLEREWIKFYKDRGYRLVNFTNGGGNPRYWSDEQRQAHSDSRKGKSYFSVLNKQRIGQPLSPETKVKLSLAHKGKKYNVTNEGHRKLSAQVKAIHANPTFKARMEANRATAIRSPKCRAKMEVHYARIRGVPLSEDHKRNVSIAVRKFSGTPEYRQKMSDIKKGKPPTTVMTDEIRAKISATLKAKHASGEWYSDGKGFHRCKVVTSGKANLFTWLRGPAQGKLPCIL